MQNQIRDQILIYKQQFAFTLAAQSNVFFSWVTGFFYIWVIIPSLKALHTCLYLSIPKGFNIKNECAINKPWDPWSDKTGATKRNPENGENAFTLKASSHQILVQQKGMERSE